MYSHGLYHQSEVLVMSSSSSLETDAALPLDFIIKDIDRAPQRYNAFHTEGITAPDDGT